MKSKTKFRTLAERPAAKFGKWALGLVIVTFILPLVLLLAFQIFRLGSLNLILTVLVIPLYGGLPAGLVSLVLGIVGIVRNEHPIKPAILSVSISILPVLFGLWVLKNYIVMGEPW